MFGCSHKVGNSRDYSNIHAALTWVNTFMGGRKAKVHLKTCGDLALIGLNC